MNGVISHIDEVNQFKRVPKIKLENATQKSIDLPCMPYSME